MLDRFLLLWLCGSSLLAFLWPVEMLQDRLPWLPDEWSQALADPFTNGVVTLRYVIGCTMFCIGWLVPKDEVRQLMLRWPMVLIGTAAQYGSMPLLAYLLAHSLPLSEDHRIGLIMVGCVPGAMASNVLTMMARGNVSYSVSLTTLATLASPFAVPFLLYWLLGEQKEIDVYQQFQFLLMFVVGPTVAGHLIGNVRDTIQKRFARVSKVVASLAILWIIAVVVGKNRDTLADGTGAIVLAVLLNVSGYMVGGLVGRTCRMEEGMSRALSLEIGMQNAGLGSTMAAAIFIDRPAVLIPTAFYTFGCMLTGIILARFWMQRDTSELPE